MARIGIGVGLGKQLRRYWTPRYYVSNTGNDALDGLTPATAWHTIAKVNATSFVPGDKIGFKKGDTWREMLIVPSSGDATNPIAFGAYGIGANPIVFGSDEVTGWTPDAGILGPEINLNVGFDADVYYIGSYGTLTWQEAAIGGRVHTAKLVAEATGSQNIDITGRGITPGKAHTVTFDYYIPSINSKCDGIQVRELGGANVWIDSPKTGFDAWHTVTVSWTAGYDNLHFYMMNGAVTNDTAIGDIVYFDNISIKADGVPIANVYNVTFAITSPFLVFKDGIKQIKGVSRIALNDHEFFVSGTTLSYRDDSISPAIADYVITASTREHCITTNGESYINISSNLEVKYGDGDIERFQDNFLEDILPVITELSNVEPTALVSDDGQQIDIWFQAGYSYTLDGISFAPIALFNGGNMTSACTHMMKVGNIYYMFTRINNVSIHLFTGTDKINFTDQGEVIALGSAVAWDDTELGNMFVWKEGTNWFMLYEARSSTSGFTIGLATASAPEGPWTKYGSNPVITGAGEGAGHPTMPRVNNEVIKYNGEYYVYYHYDCSGPAAGIYRAHSTDLHVWTVEGPIIDFHVEEDPPFVSGFGDPTLVQFKGRSYLFFDATTQGQYVGRNHINCGIDNRPLAEMLALTQ